MLMKLARFSVLMLIPALPFLLSGVVLARVTGPCAGCHTMHNSQNGSEPVAGGPLVALTRGGCVGCHSSNTNDTRTGTSDNIPIAHNSVQPTYGVNGTDGDTLAGGNFYWVATGTDNVGHNVDGICNADGTLATPPGFDGGRPDTEGNRPGGGAWPANQKVTCAGVYGCHGRHTDNDSYTALKGSHHVDDSTIDGSTVAKSYRFLLGITGKEDSDWEYRPTSTAHNQYKGKDRVDDADVTGTNTISYLCCQCHGKFHNGNGNVGDASPWLRHPTDFDLARATGTEYVYYNGSAGAGTATFSVVAPVASADVSSVLSTVTVGGSGNDTAIITCVTCHRAHGTKWDDSLRWQYSGMVAGGGGGNVGCFICHTTKD